MKVCWLEDIVDLVYIIDLSPSLVTRELNGLSGLPLY